MSKIFISYKRDDYDTVIKIKKRIEENLNIDCWIDLTGIHSIDVFSKTILEAINSCQIFLFMYSKRHNQITDFENDYTILELNYAREKRKQIIFVNIDGTPLSDWFLLYFSTKQHVNAKSKDAIDQLCADIRKIIPIQEKASEKSIFKQIEDLNKQLDKPLKFQKISAYASILSVILALVATLMTHPSLFEGNSPDKIPAQTSPTLSRVTCSQCSGTGFQKKFFNQLDLDSISYLGGDIKKYYNCGTCNEKRPHKHISCERCKGIGFIKRGNK